MTIMNNGLFLVFAFVATFFLGFLVNIIFLPFVLLISLKIRGILERVERYYEQIDESMVFRWTVAFIVAFAVAIIITQCKEGDQNQSIFIEIHGV